MEGKTSMANKQQEPREDFMDCLGAYLDIWNNPARSWNHHLALFVIIILINN